MNDSTHLFVCHCAVSASQIGQDGRLCRLHPETHPGYSTGPVGAEAFDRGVFGIALHRYFSASGLWYGVKNPE